MLSLTLTRLAAVLSATALTAIGLLVGGAGPAVAGPVPATPAHLPAQIEQLPPYQPQQFCDPTAKRGTLALAHLLTSTYRGTSIVSLTRPCGSDTSEHYDGRAIDWGVNIANAKQRAQGKAFLAWLFAPDADGNSDAMVRRLGIMYVIWNKRIWGSWSQRWEPYSCSGVTACHKDHMHISLDWSGAMKKTSYWTGTVKPPMAPPLFALRDRVTHTVSVDARDADPTPEFKLVRHARYRVTVSGSYRYDGGRHDRADAACSTTDGDHWSSAPDGAFDLWVNGSHAWHPATGRQGCDPGHVYHRTLRVRSATPLTLALHVPNPWGADGSLSVAVRRIG